jgi:hypothetical protein
MTEPREERKAHEELESDSWWGFLAYVGKVHTRVCELLARIADRQSAKGKATPEAQSEEKSAELDHE